MKKLLFLIPLLFIFCGQAENSKTNTQEETEKHSTIVFQSVNPQSKTIITRFNLPQGFTRITIEKNSFAEYLQNLPLKPHGSNVYYYNGEIKPNRVHEAVIDIDVGNRNLQQCADAIMRLRGEYLFKQKQHEKIHFNFTNGFRVDYSKWITGYRVKVEGNKTSWIKSGQPSNSYKNFRKYMNLIFTYAGTISLAKELKTVSYNNLTIGDIFIQGGSPGHAVIVVDMAINKNNDEKIFLLAQSYMPAQDIHILKNYNNEEISPWYKLNIYEENIYTPEWEFKTTNLKRFKD
ncbi:MAG: DUF4846 domain-containing protein [Calditrichia bacterium]|nr:DUF4846 domain-containing protein [Calditrichia bacterium]